MKLYKVFPTDDYSYEPEKCLCQCRGELKLDGTEVDLYTKRETHLLICQNCGGKYHARELDLEEQEKIEDGLNKEM